VPGQSAGGIVHAISDEALARAAVEAEFGSHAEPLLSLLRPSLRMVDHHDTAEEAPVRLGGPGVLPAGAPWPTWDDRPLTFLAAIDCAAVHRLLPESPLPASGTLTAWVHLDMENGIPLHLEGGPTPRHHGASRLMHHPTGLALHEQVPPQCNRLVTTTRSRTLHLVRDVMWPIGIFELPRRAPSAGLTEAHIDFAMNLMERAAAADADTSFRNRIGGWPSLYNAEWEVALVDAGIVTDRGQPDFAASGAERVMADALQAWLPFLQLDADLDAGWNWFFDGVLVFMGKADTPIEDAMAYCSRQ
jgi:hypothetical protein